MAFRARKNPEVLEKEIENGKALVEAAIKGNTAEIHTLLDSGLSVNADAYNRSLFYKSQNYMTPLQVAAMLGNDECVSVLIERGADLDALDRFDVTAIHRAAENGHLRCLQVLLDAGANCNIGTKYAKHGSYTVPYVGGTTALHLATKNNHNSCVKELILNGADYNATDESGRTSLYIAAEHGWEEGVMTHLSNAVGRDILSLPVKFTGETPLHECVRQAMLGPVMALLAHGSDVNHLNQGGYSPLHLAVQHSDKLLFEVVKHLVKTGYNTNVNLKDTTGATPLQYVCFNDNPKQERRALVAAFLIGYGAKFENLKNKHGSTLMQQELRSAIPDYTILKAMVSTMTDLPSLNSLGIWNSRQMRRHNPIPAAKCSWYQNLRQNPRTLQHICRCVVRDSLGVPRLRYIDQLPLPIPLMEYLLLECDNLTSKS